LERLRAEIAGADSALEAKRAEREAIQTDTEERVDDAKLRAQPTERMQREEEGDGGDADRPAG
ncbi:MAG: hypothetical protein H0T13_02980, partial [Actinobacteria bacterium]|nr:hypothetical protein [Actinomycetota bacterium]